MTYPTNGPLSYTQLEQLWTSNGGNPSYAALMAAIALAESSGISWETNTTDNHGTQTSWGLWQISDGTHNMPVPNILDPNVNAREAVAKLQTQGLGAWGTYDTGVYKQYLNGTVPKDLQETAPRSRGGAQRASNSSPITGIPDTPGQPPPIDDLNPIGSLGSTIQWFGGLIGWAFFILIVFWFGVILFLLGAVILVMIFAGPVVGPATAFVGGKTPEGAVVGGVAKTLNRGRSAAAAPG